MADDIVTRLLALNHPDAVDGAEEIERLRDAGCALAEGVRTGHWDDVLEAWDDMVKLGDES